jgi:hypothetical protein
MHTTDFPPNRTKSVPRSDPRHAINRCQAVEENASNILAPTRNTRPTVDLRRSPSRQQKAMMLIQKAVSVDLRIAGKCPDAESG